jgi:hypothetical protein
MNTINRFISASFPAAVFLICACSSPLEGPGLKPPALAAPSLSLGSGSVTATLEYGGISRFIQAGYMSIQTDPSSRLAEP